MSGPIILGTNSIKDTGYDVDNSLMFNSPSSDRLNRTLGTPTNNYKWTYSFWVKRGILGSEDAITGAISDNQNKSIILFRTDDQFEIMDLQSDSYVMQKKTSRKFRDPSAWYHFVISSDATLSSPETKIYVNGVEETSFATTNEYSQNQANLWNSAIANHIGASDSTSRFWDGYLAEFVFIDGQVLDPTSFGEFDSNSPNIWKPIDVSDLTFGNNGYYLDFKDSSNLGNDANGGTDWTVSNLAATDQSIDTCTNNFATLNPLNPIVHTFSEGNLRLKGTTTNWDSACSTIAASSGKWYFEMKFLALYNSLRRAAIGLVDARDQTLLATNEFGYIVTGAVGDCVGYNGNGSNNVKKNDSAQYSGTNWNVNDIICMAADLDNGAVYFRVNDSAWENSGNPESGASKTGAVTITVGEDYVFGGTAYGNTTDWQFNYGAPSFSISSGNADANGHGNFEYAVPSGYFSLCTKNLAEFG